MQETSEWSLADVHDVVAATVPDRTMLVAGSSRRTFAEVAGRSRALASFLVAAGIGLQRPRQGLAAWESGQDAVAVVLRNSTEYVEAMLGCFRARAVPFNVNHHYRPAEVADLFAMVGPAAVVYHRSLGPLVAESLGDRTVVLVDVDDGSGVAPLPGSTPYEEAASAPTAGDLPATSPDDLYMVCTGGTTGTPRAVLWRQGDIYVSAMGGAEGATAASIAAAAGQDRGSWFATPPLMHAAAQWTAFSGLHNGFTVVLHEESETLDARRLLEVAERERVSLMSIVGDAFARPMVDELARRTYDLRALETIGTGGAATSERHKQALFEAIPHVTIIDGYGSSETGGMAFGARTRGAAPAGFLPGAGAVVLSADRARVLEPGEDEEGWIARRGRVPLGYLGDEEKTRATFPVVDGQRFSVPGDRGRLDGDGTIAMLGRDALVVNTGGEKVFVEEVEAVLRLHHDIDDALVLGRPSERFGQEVVAVVQLRDGAVMRPAEVREVAARSLARFKAPRAVAFVEVVPRLVNGKADYARAQQHAAGAAPA